MQRFILLAPWLVLLQSLFLVSAQAAPKAQLWAFWQQSDETNPARINHQPWQSFLDTYLSASEQGVNELAYGQVSAQDRQRLQRYIQDLSEQPILTYNQNQQMAYWINLYNALTVEVVLQHYPVDSILDIDISPGFLANGPWDKKLIRIAGEEVSLNDIEHRILRPIWQDSRIHYAVNCASFSCPNLAKQAYQADQLEAMLNQAAKSYINNSRGLEIIQDRALVSKIYDWYLVDFGGSEESLKKHLQHFAKPQLASQLNAIDDFSYRYDWSLNDAVER